MLACLDARRKIVVCGVGKSGSIGRKFTATLNSTGATSVNLNAQDALHGDLGVLDEGDVVVLLSYSGETQELLDLLPHLRRVDARLIAITGNTASALAKNSDIVLDVHVEREACPLNLAPTSSTTSMLVLCDALAMVLLEARGLSNDDFAKYHPNGSLGRALLTKVGDVMRKGDSHRQSHLEDHWSARHSRPSIKPAVVQPSSLRPAACSPVCLHAWRLRPSLPKRCAHCGSPCGELHDPQAREHLRGQARHPKSLRCWRSTGWTTSSW